MHWVASCRTLSGSTERTCKSLLLSHVPLCCWITAYSNTRSGVFRQIRPERWCQQKQIMHAPSQRTNGSATLSIIALRLTGGQAYHRAYQYLQCHARELNGQASILLGE